MEALECGLFGGGGEPAALPAAPSAQSTSPAMSSATIFMAFSPVPATGWGRITRGMSGMPADRDTKSPWGENLAVTRATAGMWRRAAEMASRTVPLVQLPQWP